MHTSCKPLAAWLAAALLPAIPALSPAQSEGPRPLPSPEPPGERVLLTVDGTPITETQVRDYFVARFARQLEQMPPEQQAMLQPQIEEMVMSELISKTLLLNAANKEGLEVEAADLEENVSQIAESLPPGSTLEEFADSIGMTLAQVKAQISDDMKIRRLIDKVTDAVDKPGDAEVKQYYDENPEAFSREESVEASHILVSTQGVEDEAGLAEKKAKAESIRSQLIEKEGGNFEELAQAHSDCPSRAEGGSLGEFQRGQMVPEFEAAAFSQKPGEIGEMVQTQFGWHIIKVTGKTEAKKMDYAEVKEELAEGLHEERKSERMQTYLEELRTAAKIERPGQPAADGDEAPPKAG